MAEVAARSRGATKGVTVASAVRRAPLIPLGIIAIFSFMAIFAPYISPYSPTEPSLLERMRPPFWLAGGSWDHLLGTDTLGRDLFTRIVYGARVSLSASVLSILLGGFFGLSIGLIAGYFGGRVDIILMRATDTFLAFPTILIAILLAITLGPSFTNVIIAVGLVLWSRYARVLRGEARSLMKQDFIAQARVVGCSPLRIMVRHLFPNVVNTFVVLLTLQVGYVIILEATLSFLGAGIPPPTPAWGAMVSEGRQYLLSAWWVSFFPGLAISLVGLAFNLFGDWLRDTLDPKLRQL